jgi:lipooligosaccharide transport system permease protein
MSGLDRRLPRLRAAALPIWRRNLLVWRKLMAPSLFFNFGEPFIYLLGLGFGLGHFIGEMAGMPYLMFLASGLVASSAMNTASFEGMFSVYTRMVPQQTYDAILATPIEVDDIVAGEMLWCATKGAMSACAILVVAAILGAVQGWSALLAVPCFLLVGLCFAGPALMVSAVSPSYDFFNYYATLVMTPMFIFSGVFYPVDTLPAFLRTIVEIFPLAHAVALVRPLVAGQSVENAALHAGVLLAYAAITYYVAVVLVRRRLIK